MIGKTISHYKIIEKLGEGGMGEVFLAEDTKLERKVALKFLPIKMTSDSKARKRFEREARAAAALNHPNIVTVYEINEFEGQVYIAMEYVKGETLKGKKEMPIEEIIDIAIQVTEGLAEAHQAGIIHRDIKLQNLILEKSGRVKILDFGLAKLKGASKITQEISRLGTVDYMSPEQAKGEEPDFRTDTWSLGVVLYELVTGQLPFKGEHEQAVIHSILYESPQPPGEIRANIPAKLEKIIFKCLRKDRTYRYPSIVSLTEDLKQLNKTVREETQESTDRQKEITGPVKETERRLATVIVVEISAYDEKQEQMDTQKAVFVVSCVEMFCAVVEKYGGGLGKVVGNSFVAYFGVPAAIEGAPKKAVNAAIEMRNSLYRFNREKNLAAAPFDLRAGINTGMVIAGAIGTMAGVGKENLSNTYHVMGDTVTLASQLKDFAAKGQICTGPLTHRYTKNEFDYKELKPALLEGKTKPVPVFELLSTREKIHRPQFGSQRMIYSGMVGRDKELDNLRFYVLKVINGNGSIVSVIGEAGIGKSRLIAELKKTEDIKKVTLLEGRALSIGKNLSYFPIIDILKNWASIKEENTEKEALSKLEQTIANIYPDHEGAAEVFPFVATMMGMKLTGKHAERVKGIEGEALEKLILKNIRDLMIKSSERRPVVFFIEDLHWADISSIEMSESLFRLAEKYRILFINVFRPNYRETGERVLETIRERYGRIHTEIYLEPLEKKQCEILIRNLVKVSGLPIDIRTAITNRAEGNPFFIEEVVRSFIDEGVVELRDGKFKITEKIESVRIPETIQDVLMARLDRLDETTRTLLKEASVIGRYFFYKVLAEVAKTIGDIDDRLEYLKGIQLIHERVRLEEIEYFFKHALTREVTYESILLKKRKELHLNVANAIESVFSVRLHEFYGVLALHYSRGENLEKAGEYLIKAGEEALKAAASREALNYYQEAMKFYLKKSGDAADPEKIAMFEKNIGLAFYNKGNMVEAVEYFDKVLEYWGVRRTKNKFIALLKLYANILWLIKNLYFPSKREKKIQSKRDMERMNLVVKWDLALSAVDINRWFMETIRLLRGFNTFEITKGENKASLYTTASILFSYTGISFKISRKMLDYAKNYIDKNDIKSLFVFKLSEFLHNLLSGNWDKNFEYDEHLIDQNLNIGEIHRVSTFLVFCGSLKIEQGNFNEANLLAKKLDEIGETYDNDLTRANKYILSAGLLFKRRKLHDALNEADVGIYYLNRVGQKLLAAAFSGAKSYIQILLRDIKGAEKTLSQAKELASHLKRAIPSNISSLLMSQFLFDLYMLEESVNSNNKIKISQFRKKAYHSGKALVKNSRKYAAGKTEAFKLTGVYYWLIGKQKKALAWWNKSIRMGEHLGARPELARTYMEVGKRLREKKNKYRELNGIHAQEYLKKARVLFKEMEMEWDLDQLEKIKSP